MIEIKPTSLGVLGDATKLTVTVLPFSTTATTCSTYYELKSEDGKRLAEGNYQLTEAEFAAWGSDNVYVENIVLQTLNLERK